MNLDFGALLLYRLKHDFNFDQDDKDNPGLPAEGMVVRVDPGPGNESGDLVAFKLKSFRFLEGETKALDAGTPDMETEQTLIAV